MENEQEREISSSLYSLAINDDGSFSYDKFLELYEMYLGYYVYKKEKCEAFYQNLQFLLSVVGDFDSYQFLMFGKEDYDFSMNQFNEHILYHTVRVQQGVKESIIDRIFVLSAQCANLLPKEHSIINNNTLLEQLYFNTCRIENTLNKYQRGNYKGH